MFALSNLIMILRGCEREKCPETIKEVNNIAKRKAPLVAFSVVCWVCSFCWILFFYFFYLFIFETGPCCLPLADLTLM